MTRTPPSAGPATTAQTPRATRRGRPVGDQDAKRHELLAAAMAVIAEHGYAGASLRKVADRAGHTTGAVTYYFENKEGMMAAVIQSLFEKFDIDDGGEDARAIRTGLRRSLDWAQSDRNAWLVLFQVLAHARHQPAFAETIQSLYSRFRARLTVLVSRGQRDGIVRKDIPAVLLADQISAISDGWMMLLPIEPERFTPARIEALLDATVTLISPPRGASRA